MDATATYVYCVAHAQVKPRASRPPAGLPQASPPRLVAAGSPLWLVCASVPLARYGPGALDDVLRDLRWVGDIALAHESVVEHFAAQSGITVVPMKLFTMFSTDARAVEEMRGRRRDILRVVKRIAGCEEWGVRVTRGTEPAAPSRPAARPASGAAFLASKKQARDDARDRNRTAADFADAVFAGLSSLSREATRRDDVPEGAARPPLLDAAFLVAASQRTRFRSAARKLAAAAPSAGADVAVTGPWPAYNFVHEAGQP